MFNSYGENPQADIRINGGANDPWSRFWGLGYHSLVPIIPGTKRPGERNGSGWDGLVGWQNVNATENDVDRWRDMGAGIGIICRDGLLAFDVDCLDPVLSDRIGAEIESELGLLPKRVGAAPKQLLLCRTSGSYARSDISFDGGVLEFRTSGQFVADGIHPDTLRPYTWPRDLPPTDELPYVAPEAIDRLCDRLWAILPHPRIGKRKDAGAAEVDQEKLKGAHAKVIADLQHCPNDATWNARRKWLEMAYALKAASADWPEEGRAAFLKWCADWTEGEYREDYCEATWDGLRPPFQIGAGYVRAASMRASPDWRPDILEHLERIKPTGIDPTPYTFPEPSKIPPRASLYGGHYMRKFLSATIAQSKVGKSTLVLAEALAMASGKPLLGVQPAGRFRVWWWNGEDPHDELERRVAAALKHYGLTREDIGDRLLLNSGREMPILLATQGRHSADIKRETSLALIKALVEKQIDVGIFDPFISLHRVSENDNNAIDAVAKECAWIAEQANMAFEAVHHSRKLNGMGAVVEDGRGASSLLGATRSMRALSKMDKGAGGKAGIGNVWRSLFRFSDVSSNMAPPADEDAETWLRIVGVNLENGEGDETDRVMKGDRVGVAEVYNLREAQGRASALEAAQAPSDAETSALSALRGRRWRKDPRAGDWAGHPIARAYGFDLDTEGGKTSAKNMIRRMIGKGQLVEFEDYDSQRHLRPYVKLTQISAADLFS